jgi:hypothetical protein
MASGEVPTHPRPETQNDVICGNPNWADAGETAAALTITIIQVTRVRIAHSCSIGASPPVYQKSTGPYPRCCPHGTPATNNRWPVPMLAGTMADQP